MKRPINPRLFIKTFGCIQNSADSERILAFYWEKGYRLASDWKEADLVLINTCIIRESAENRAYGLINLVNKWNKKYDKKIQICVTGCLVGKSVRQKNGRGLLSLQKRFPAVSGFLPIDKISYKIEPLRDKNRAALIPISSGCNNYCSYCIVPTSRGKEISRDFQEILEEVDKSITNGFREIVLIGQNVNSYGTDLIDSDKFVSMGKNRLKTLFPKLLSEIAQKPLDKISFISSNPWDFDDKLIEVIAKNKNIDRLLHLPLQSGDDEILTKMNRGYTADEYLKLVSKIREKVADVRFSTDIIVGFPGESERAFENTKSVCEKVGFEIAYINKYSPRKGTVSADLYPNDIPQAEKKRRWDVLNKLINTKG
ncbi:MAG: MiaB/RimO family radical SAM methylthiotransferase [Candidatus Shapirobacteria bacterium]